MDKDKRILEMLLEGKSYTDIMAELYVSPQRIVVVKKRNKEILSHLDNRTITYTLNKDTSVKETETTSIVLPVTAPPIIVSESIPTITPEVETVVLKPSSYSDVGRVPVKKQVKINSALDILQYYLSFTVGKMSEKQVYSLLRKVGIALKSEELSQNLTTALVHVQDVLRRCNDKLGFSGKIPKDEIVKKAIEKEEAVRKLKELYKSTKSSK